jgi:hypothetical protein
MNLCTVHGAKLIKLLLVCNRFLKCRGFKKLGIEYEKAAISKVDSETSIKRPLTIQQENGLFEGWSFKRGEGKYSLL